MSCVQAGAAKDLTGGQLRGSLSYAKEQPSPNPAISSVGL